ncbi:head-to-tail adaptor [Mycobacterium phage JacoRen57]|nr:head-to-tail adaptor [Mycobacterium phage JacoRen57]
MENPFDSDEGKTAIKRRLPGVDDETVQDYIEDAWARATSVAPCIALPTFPKETEIEQKTAELKAILRGIILRWHEAQAGGLTGKTNMAGPYQQSVQLDARPKRGFQLQPSEIVDLQRLCMKKGRPFSVDTMPDDPAVDIPLYGVVVNGSTEGLHGPAGEWSPDAPVLDV